MDITGFSAFSLMKDKNYRVFMILTFLAIIPFNLYHVYGSMILADEHVQNITVTLNLGQLAEMFFLVITTSILIKSGIKNTLIFGMIALVVRYASFYIGAETGLQWFYYIGIIVHGLIFGLFFVGGQVYTDNVAPKEMKAQAQGLLFFLVWGHRLPDRDALEWLADRAFSVTGINVIGLSSLPSRPCSRSSC